MRGPRDIVGLVPHAGSMCLLDGVERWDERALVCRASSHRSPGNPLRRGGRLSAVHAVEYAAQAIAAHRSLVAPPGRALGQIALLVSLNDVVIHVTRLDEQAEVLEIEARRLLGLGDGALYHFMVHTGGKPICHGRAGVLEPR